MFAHCDADTNECGYDPTKSRHGHVVIQVRAPALLGSPDPEHEGQESLQYEDQ